MFGLTAWLILSALGAAQGAWLELTPLASETAPAVMELKVLPALVRNPLPAGLALVCSGGTDLAVTCSQQYLESDAAVMPVLRKGVQVTAKVHAGKDPLAGVRLALVPKDLRSRRFITLPLGREKGKSRLLREIATDAAGRFKTPQLAPGEYVFQLSAPGGQVLRKDVSVPSPESLLPRWPRPAEAEAVLDLGEIGFDSGVSLAVFVTGPGGEPVPEALVGAYQRDPAGENLSFETAANREGKAVISGLAPTRPAEVVCLAPGFLRFQQHFDTPPPTIGCFLEPLARIDGIVVDSEKNPVASAMISSKAFGRPAGTGRDGRFQIINLAGGTYELTAAAPGFAPERVSVSLEPGERRELPPIVLSAGREVEGVVKDGLSGESVTGARVVSVEPPGAVDALSGEEGEISFAVGEETLRLRASAEGYPDADVAVEPAKLAEDELVKIELRPGGRLRVEMWDEEADAPCAGCAVGIQSRSSGRYTTIVTDGQGAALSAPLEPGSYTVSPVLERSLGGMVRVSGGQDTREVEVVAGAVTAVRLGEKSQLLQVRFRPPVPTGWSLTGTWASGSRAAEPLTDGSFTLRRRPGSAMVLSLFGGGNVSVRQTVLAADDDRTLIELALPGGAIRGTLVEGDTSSAGRVVSLVSASDGTVRASALIPGSEGGFTIPFLSPGTYTLLMNGRPLRTFSLAADQQEELGRISLSTR
jgi:hypothetical protein